MKIIILFVIVFINIGIINTINLKWNPIVDECKFELSGFKCEGTVDANRKPDPVEIATAAQKILDSDNRRVAVQILTNHNLAERLEISTEYTSRHPELKMLVNMFSKPRKLNYVDKSFNEFLYALFNPVPLLYYNQLWSAVNQFSSSTDLRSTRLLIMILGSLSNNGLKYMDALIKEKKEISLVDVMKRNNKFPFPENLINLIGELLEGTRKESTEIEQKDIKKDLEILKANLRIPNKQRDKNEKFIREILVKRSFLHVRKLFSEYQAYAAKEKIAFDFSHLITDDSVENADDLFKIALSDLYNIIMDRRKHFASIMKSNYSYTFFTNIAVSRSEIDLKNIREMYMHEYRTSLSDRIKESYYEEEELDYRQGILNLVEPSFKENEHTKKEDEPINEEKSHVVVVADDKPVDNNIDESKKTV